MDAVKTLPLLQRKQPTPPVRILQFGTGRFLRGFADFFVDRANRLGCFEGSIVAVQSTGEARAEALTRQGGCYTLWTRDASDHSYAVQHAISQALVAHRDWDAILALARSTDLQMVFSNTTEVGLSLAADDNIRSHPPHSFPGKLTAVLYERAQHFAFDPAHGLVILPCELVADNGSRLQSLVVQTARRQNLEARFLSWLNHSTTFCNTLVDRIVPGTPPRAEHQAAENRLGYRDEMLITAEAYRLWAIEGNAALRRRISFADADPGIVVTEDITPYRVRKMRLLNGGHTLTAVLGLLAGNRTVLNNMSNPVTAPFINALLRREIGPTLPVDPGTVEPYINDILDRWRNPHLAHQLIDITLQSTTKMRHRVVPSIVAYHARYGTVPHRIALGFAAYLLFMRDARVDQDGQQNTWYPVRDDHAQHLRACWKSFTTPQALVRSVCRDSSLWGMDLTQLEGWTATVAKLLDCLMKHGAATAIGHIEGHNS